MSIKAINWARDQRLPAPQKVLLMVLASHHNPRDERCFPSQETLSWETGLSRRAVQVASAALVKSKHLTIIRERKMGQWATCSYALNMVDPKSLRHAHEVRTDHSKKTAHGENDHHAHEVRTKGYINTRRAAQANGFKVFDGGRKHA